MTGAVERHVHAVPSAAVVADLIDRDAWPVAEGTSIDVDRAIGELDRVRLQADVGGFYRAFIAPGMRWAPVGPCSQWVYA